MKSFIKSHTRSQSVGSPEYRLDYSSKSNVDISSSSIPLVSAASPQVNQIAFSTPTVAASPFPSDSALRPSSNDSALSPISATASSPRLPSNSTTPTMFSSSSNSILLTPSSSSSLKKLNPITFIRRRRASSDEFPTLHTPSVDEYREAGSIFGTRMHDWGSTPSTSPVFHPTPVCSSPSVNVFCPQSLSKSSLQVPSSPVSPLAITQIPLPVPSQVPAAKDGQLPTTSKLAGSDLELVKEEEEESPFVHGLGIYKEKPLGQNSSEKAEETHKKNSSLDLIDLKKELSSIIRQSRVIDDQDIPPVPDLEAMLEDSNFDLAPTPGLTFDKKSDGSSPETSFDLEDDAHSEFSFEEVGVGRSASIKYHKPSIDFTSHPRYQLGHFAPPCASDEDELSDNMEDYDFDAGDFMEDDGHLFGVTTMLDQGLPYMSRKVPLPVRPLVHGSIARTAPLRVSTTFSSTSDIEYESANEDDDDGKLDSPFTPNQQKCYWDQSYYSELDDSFEDGDENYNALLDEVNAVPSDMEDDLEDAAFSRSSSTRKPYMGLRKSKTYAFEGKYPRPAILRRQTSVFKIGTGATVTLFSGSPTLSKTSSTSSSGSADDTMSSSASSSSLEYLTSAEIAELNYGSFMKDLPQPSIPRCSSLTPISERSYDSDYSTSKHDNYDII